MNLFRRVWHLINRPRFERELTREMRGHRDQMRDPSTFGDPHRHLEYARDAWGWNWLDDALQDFRLGLRALVKSPAFAITSTLILTFGIGLNLTLFQLASATLLRPPAVQSPETLARFYRQAPNSHATQVPWLAIDALSRDTSVLSAVLGTVREPVPWGADQSIIDAAFVTPNWFDELGYQAMLGRAFNPAIDDARAAAPVVVVSFPFWQSHLGADPTVIGSAVEINKRAATIIGVMPRDYPGFTFGQPAIFLPIRERGYYFPDSDFLRSWESNVDMYGRFKPGLTRAAVRDGLRNAMAALHQEQPKFITEGEWLEPMTGDSNFMPPEDRWGILGVISVIGLLCGLVLAVAAANVGNLVLSRATSRARELGVRIALGARRSRIVRQLLMETLPLGLIGAAGGLLVATWSAKAIAAGSPAASLSFSLDWPAIVATVVLSVVALVVIGALPAWKVAQQELIAAIKDGGQQVSVRLDRARVRRFLVSAQVAGSCLLLVIALMMTRNLQRLLLSDLGFKFDKVAVLQTALGAYGIADDSARAFWTTVKERVIANPDVADASLALSPPLGGRIYQSSFMADNMPGLRVFTNGVDPTFFSVMQIPLMAGRTFASVDDPSTTVIISKTLAEQMYGTTDVVGRGFPKSAAKDTIIGVAGDAHTVQIEASSGVAEVYRPLTPKDYNEVVLVVRTHGDPSSVVPALREAAMVADPRVRAGARTLSSDFERNLEAPRFASVMSMSIGLITLLLASLGIFGVVSYGVALRTREIGIHLALGASSAAILRLIMRSVLSPVLIGMTLGLVAAAPIALALSQSPLQLRAWDPMSYAIALSVFVSAAIVSATMPARRLLRSNPLGSLRHE